MIFEAHITAARIFITFSAFSQNIKEPVWSLSYYNNPEPWRFYIIHALCSAQSLFGRAGPPGSVSAPEAPPDTLWGRMGVGEGGARTSGELLERAGFNLSAAEKIKRRLARERV